MTVSTSTSRIAYTGNGVTTSFSVPFPFIQDDYLIVIRTVIATGVETILTLDSVGANGYSVTGAGEPTGTVVVVTAPTALERLSIIRSVDATQEADFVANDPLPSEVIEDSLDKLTMLFGDLAGANGLSRVPILYAGDIDGSGRYNSNGNRYANAADGVSATDLATVQQITSAGSGSFVQSGTGAVIRTMQNKARDIVSVKDFGAVGDGVTNDTAAFQAAVLAADAIYVPPGDYIITAPVEFAGVEEVDLYGHGSDVTRLVASGNFDAIIKMAAGSARNNIRGLKLDSGTTTTKGISLDGINHRVIDCELVGSNVVGGFPLAFVNCSFNQFVNCRFNPLTADLWSIWIDNRADSGLVIATQIDSCNFAYSGNGIHIQRTTPASPRCEGTSLYNCSFGNSGLDQLKVDSHYGLLATGCAFEECLGTAITLDDNDRAQIIGCSIGLGLAATSPGIVIEATNGKGTIINGNIFRAGTYGIEIKATAGVKVYDVVISNNVFNGHSEASLLLDSVGTCSITGNVEIAGPGFFADGSWSTLGTNAVKGEYLFSGNAWSTSLATVFDTASAYYATREILGPGLSKRGAEVVAVAATSVVVTHGLATNPTNIQATPLGTTGVGAWWITGIGATTFTINWVTNTTVTWSWRAEV